MHVISLNQDFLIRAHAGRRQRGLTLIEAAMVLAIATLVVAGIMVFFQSASISSKTNEAMGQLGQLQQAIRSVYSGQSSYNGLTAADLIDTRAVPTKMVGAGNTLRHAFNGAITIAPADVNGGTDNGFIVAFASVPPEACSKMATMDLGTGLVSLAVSGGAANTFNGPATPGDAAAACGTSSSAQSSLTWTFS